MNTLRLHEAIDLALAQYLLAHPGSLPSETSVLDLVKWHASRLDTMQLDADAPATPLPNFDEALETLSNDILLAIGALAMGNSLVQRLGKALFAARPLIRAVCDVARRHPDELAAATGPRGDVAIPHEQPKASAPHDD